MKYRDIPRIGLSVSEIGFGGEYLEGQSAETVRDALDCAIKHGINIFDCFMPQPEVRDHIAAALRGRREKMIIQGHIGAVCDEDGQYVRTRDLARCKASFEDLMGRLDTNYIDIAMLHYIDSEEDFEIVFHGPTIEYVLELKKKGTIKAIGMSSHSSQIAQKAVETGLIDVLLFSINPAYDIEVSDKDLPAMKDFKELKGDQWTMNPDRIKLYRTCEEMGIGITVMKTLGSGRLLHDKDTPFSAPLTVTQCCHYALTRPGVVSVLLGCRNVDEVREALKYETATDSEKSFGQITWTPQFHFLGKCMYCNHCLPCPSNIDVAMVHKLMDMAEIHDVIPATVLDHYQAMQKKASDCIECGSCEKNCPFQVPIRINMKRAIQLFE